MIGALARVRGTVPPVRSGWRDPCRTAVRTRFITVRRGREGPYPPAMTTISYPPKPSPGDRIAVISPSSGLPELFPHPYELGLRRLREDYGLEPVEYPTTRKMGTSPL